MRYIWIDIAKGIGIFLVILGHLVTYGSYIFNWIFSFHMPLFFFLSGYVFKYTINTNGYFKKITKNLILPYIIISLIGCWISLLIPELRPESIKTVLIETFYFVQPESLHVGQIWFLFCLAVVQIFFIQIKNLNLKKDKEYLLIGLSCIFAYGISYIYANLLNEVTIVNGYHLPRLPFKLDSALMALFFFYLGYEDKERNIIFKIIENKKYIVFLILICLFIVNIIFGLCLNKTINLAMNSYGNLLYFLISSISGIYMVIIISSLIKKAQIIEFYGKNSLAIFSLHSFFLYLFAGILTKLYSEQFTIMKNIPLDLCILGFIVISIAMLPIPTLYKFTVSKVINTLYVKKYLDTLKG